MILERLALLRRRILAMVPARRRATLQMVVERAFNAGPDALFVAARTRFGRRLERRESAEPPALLRFAAYRRHVPAAVESFEIMGRPDMRMVNVESVGTQVIYWTGYQWVASHGAGLEIWERLCARASKIVELGADVGFYTIAGGSVARGEYTAFEPHPHSCATLRANLDLNGLRHVQVVEAAAVPPPAPATVELICSTGTDRAAPSGAMVRGSSFVTEDIVSDSAIVVVAAASVDGALVDSDLVKIDVEGLEAKLLLGGWDVLCASKPLIMVEIHDANADLRGLLPRLLAELDATAYAMHRDRLVPVGDGVLELGPLYESCQSWDFLIVPSDRSAMVDDLVQAG